MNLLKYLSLALMIFFIISCSNNKRSSSLDNKKVVSFSSSSEILELVKEQEQEELSRKENLRGFKNVINRNESILIETYTSKDAESFRKMAPYNDQASSGDFFYYQISSPTGYPYLYFVNFDSTNYVAWATPKNPYWKDSIDISPVQTGKAYTFPGDQHVIELDKTTGREDIFLIALRSTNLKLYHLIGSACLDTEVAKQLRNDFYLLYLHERGFRVNKKDLANRFLYDLDLKFTHISFLHK